MSGAWPLSTGWPLKCLGAPIGFSGRCRPRAMLQPSPWDPARLCCALDHGGRTKLAGGWGHGFAGWSLGSPEPARSVMQPPRADSDLNGEGHAGLNDSLNVPSTKEEQRVRSQGRPFCCQGPRVPSLRACVITTWVC